MIRRTRVLQHNNQPWSRRPLERLQVTSLRGAVGAAAAIVLISRVRDVPWRNSKGCWREGANMENVGYLGYFEMTRCLGCDQCFRVWHSISMTVSNTNGSTCYPWGSSLAPPCVGQGVEFPRTWDAGILDRNLKSLEIRYSWLLLSDSCLFILPISFLDSSKAAQTTTSWCFCSHP